MTETSSLHARWLARLVIGFVGLLVLPALACGTIANGSGAQPDETELARSVEETLAAIDATEQHDATQVAAAVPNATATRPPTATHPPTATPPPTATFTPTPSEPTIGEISVSSQVDDANQPVDAGDAFSVGVARIYATFPYSGMKEGMRVKFYWELNGKEWYTSVIQWKTLSSGRYMRFIHYQDESPLDAGNWALKVYLEGELVQSVHWKIE